MTLTGLLISKDASEESLRKITRCAMQCFIVLKRLHAEGMPSRTGPGNRYKSECLQLISSYNTGIIDLYNIIKILDVPILDKDKLIPMQNELNQLYIALMKENGQSTRREVEAILNETLSNRNLIDEYYEMFKSMIDDQNIYNLGDITRWPRHWATEIKRLIMKIDNTKNLITEAQFEKDKIEYQIEQCHISGGVHQSLIDEHRKNILISKHILNTYRMR